jgi:SAM-dependent methyltransferase
MTSLLDRWNEQYFSGRLSADVLGHLQELPGQSAEVHAFVERIFRCMHEARVPAADLSELLAWGIGFFPSRILPGAWGGLVPPITIVGRHAKIDEYLADNPWHALEAGAALLDLGCGFPPLTTVDAATTREDWRIIGADPSFGPFIVSDARGDYACIRSDGTVRYFQPGIMDLARWDELFRDPAVTRARFADLFQRLHNELPPDDGTLFSVTAEGATLTRHPLKSYERANLTFQEGGFGQVRVADLDAVRCMNVLMYFDQPSRRQAREWIASVLKPSGIFVCGVNWFQSTNSRYTVFQREADRLVPREFAFSIDNIRSLQLATWFALHDDDDETRQMVRALAAVRGHQAFMRDFDRALDDVCTRYEICARKPDGNLGGVAGDLSPAELHRRLRVIESEIAEAGFRERAVDVLSDAGHNAWINCVGHIAMAPVMT